MTQPIQTSLRAERSFLSNVVALATGNASAQILVFLSFVLLGQRLGAALFGEISFAQATFVYLTLLADPGLRTLGIRQIARLGSSDDDLIKLIRTQLILLALGLALIWSLFLLLSQIHAPRNWLMWGYGLSILPLSLGIDWVFTGKEHLGPVASSRLLRGVFLLAAIWLLVKTPNDLYWVPLLFGLSHLIASGYLYVSAFRRHSLPPWQFSPKLSFPLLRQALPLGLSAIMIQIYYSLDVILLGIFRTPQEIGYYSADYKIILFLIGISDATAAVLLPAFSRLATESPEHKLPQAQLNIFKILTWLGWGLSLGLFCLAKEVIALLFGATYLPGALALQILAWNLFLIFSNMPFGVLLLALHREKVYTVAVTVGAVLNLGLNLIFIPTYGMVGAAVATLSSELIVWIFFLWFLRDLRLTIPWSYVPLRLVAPGIAMAGALTYLPVSLVYKVLIGAVVYLSLTRLSGAWSMADLKNLVALLSLKPRLSEPNLTSE